MTKFTAACVQMTAGTEPADNLKISSELIREAAAKGADFISTPEVTNMMEPYKVAAREKAQLEQHIGCSDADKRRIRDGYRRAHEAAESTKPAVH